MHINTTIQQHPERSVPDEAAAILNDGIFASLSVIQDNVPYIIPFTYHFEPADQTLYLHGGLSSRALLALVNMPVVCAEVTLTDGMVFSKSAKYFSVNYRSVLCFGTVAEITELHTKQYYFERMIRRYYPNSVPGIDYFPASDIELGATLFLKMSITSFSAKKRTGPPKGPGDNNPEIPGKAGVVPLQAGISGYQKNLGD